MSDVCIINAGAPQGTRAGPNGFKVLINDLRFDLPYIKYVDDLSVATRSTNPTSDEMQSVADNIYEWAITNRMILNTDKTKEMVIYFGRRYVKDEIKSTCIQKVAIE